MTTSGKKTSREKKSAWEVALKLLAGRDFSRAEMEARLVRRGFDEQEIQQAVQKLLKYNYIVETGGNKEKLREMAENYLEKKNVDVIEKKRLRSLENFLLRKGFDTDLVNEFLEKLSDEID